MNHAFTSPQIIPVAVESLHSNWLYRNSDSIIQAKMFNNWTSTHWTLLEVSSLGLSNTTTRDISRKKDDRFYSLKMNSPKIWKNKKFISTKLCRTEVSRKFIKILSISINNTISRKSENEVFRVLGNTYDLSYTWPELCEWSEKPRLSHKSAQ